MKELDQFSEEELKGIINDCTGEIYNSPTSDETTVSPRILLSLARIALAAKTAVPSHYVVTKQYTDSYGPETDRGVYITELDASKHKDDHGGKITALYAAPVLNSPELPDSWVACDERMPDVGERDWRTALPVIVKCEIGVIPAYYGFVYQEGEKCFGFMESFRFGDGSGSRPEEHESRLMLHVTHWMPLPAAPKPEK